MPKNLRFWINVGLITAGHVALLIGFIRWSSASNNHPNAQSVIWMSGGAGDGIVTKKTEPPLREKLPLHEESKAEKPREQDEDQPVLTSAPSEIQLSAPAPTPRSMPTPKPSAAPQTKPTPKPTPKLTPKPSPKRLTVAKAKPSPKPKPKHEENEAAGAKSETADIAKEKIVLAKNESSDLKPAAHTSPATQTGVGKGTTAGAAGGHAGGSVNESQFGWYGSMLHDRFYSEWAQPTSVADTGGKNSVMVKLRIEKDGHVSSFEIVRSSGNAELDDSVRALANRVSHVEPLPDGLGKGDHYDVKINFELNSE
jgi:protein TonB